MKNTALLILISFVIGALIGFGADRFVLRNQRASEEQKMEERADGDEISVDRGSDLMEKKDEMMGPETMMEGEGGMMEKQEGAMMEKKDAMMGPGAMMPEPGGKNTITVENQNPGREAQLKTVTVSGNSWVVIHDDANGKPGRILGAQRFDPGTYANRTVELVNNGTTVEGKIYYAMVHADDGDKQFDYKIDLPIKDDQGNPIMARFITTGTSATQ